jgi:predicted nucleic-acid-binding protein
VIAIDTNVVVRIVAADDRVQLAKALRLISEHAVYVGPTVLLECEWVLKSAYMLDRPAIERSLRAFVGLANVHTYDDVGVTKALDLFAAGVDLADALHLGLTGTSEVFATFDSALRKRGSRHQDAIKIISPD